MRSKSEAQAVALESERHTHPTKGTVRDDETKRKISESLSESWEKLSDKEYKRRSEISKTNFDNMTDAKKEEFRRLSAEAIRTAAKEGSKLEKFLFDKLTEKGLYVEFHKSLAQNLRLEVDLFVRDLKTAIEVDGPSHFLPIWGEEHLTKTKASDLEKNGILLARGYSVIRLQTDAKNDSLKLKNDCLRVVLECLEKVRLGNSPQLLETKV